MSEIKPESQFSGKVIFITGAAHGQGRAAALAFAQRGAGVFAFDLLHKLSYPAYELGSPDALASLEKEASGLSGEIATFAGDVRSADSVRSAVDHCLRRFGHIDIVFNNAGISAYGLSHELQEEAWDSMLDINLKGAWLVGKYTIPHLIAQKSGLIINNSSVAGLRGFKRLSHYCASKFGLVGLTKAWALELAEFNIRVVSIHPTGVNTPMNDGLAALEGSTPLEIAQRSASNLLDTPWIETEDVVEALLFLAGKGGRYITGSQLVLDAGLLTR